MNNNTNKFRLYVFLSTFARNLIEVFIPVILYKNGYSLREVIFYFLIANLVSAILSYPCVLFAKKYSNKILSIIGIISFLLLQIFLNRISVSYTYLILVGILFAIYRRCYWLPRRYYNLKIIRGKNISTKYSIISIINQVGIIVSTYIGSLLLDYVGIEILTIISIIIFIVSIIPLFKFKFEHEKNSEKIEFFKTLKMIPKGNIYQFGSYELLNVLKFLFALYLFIYVKDNFKTIGIVNLITNLAVILSTYLYGRMLDKDKNYLKFSILMICITFLLKANVTNYLVIAIAFLEGIFSKMYEVSINREFLELGEKFEYYNYNLVYELTQNVFRTLVVLLLFIFNIDLKIMIYITLLFIIIGCFIDFKEINKKKFKVKD